ncbi:MAG: T9SS type A sorting domain-containing protein [Bacteroidales bacterium]|nr:T9SS type A sorting domain-containing protein [Bacteroidales bacterium]
MKKYMLLFLTLINFSFYAHSQDVQLTPGFTIFVNDSLAAPIRNTLDILQRDLKNVLGEESTIVTDLSGLEGVSNAMIIINEEAGRIADVDSLGGFERHKLFAQNRNLVLQGSDTRGTLYAIYTFSEQFLGVKPLWFWSSSSFLKKNNVNIPSSYSFDSGEPYVKYRAWFPNDQDMFSPWRKVSETNNEIWLETMLRLKLNAVEKGSLADYSDELAVSEEAKLIDQYGLKISFTHTVALNSHLGNWDDYWTGIRKITPPAILLSNQTQLEEFWRYNIRSMVESGIEPIWGIGFRGEGDIPFWETYTDAPQSMTERAQVINEMVARQVQILKEETGLEAPLMKMTFYNENSDFLAAGLLSPPEEESFIWCFVAARRDHYPNDDIQTISIPAEVYLGYYMNLQFTSTGSHLAQAEGLWKMERNLRYLDAKNSQPLHFSVLNAGNLREHLLTLSANADMMWHFNNYDSDNFLQNFCSYYYGPEHADIIAELYRNFFYAYWNQKKSDLEGFDRQYIFQDLRYKQAVRQISDKFFKTVDLNPLKDYSSEQVPNRTFSIVPADNGVDNQVEAMLNGTGESYDKFSRVVHAADSLYNLLDDVERLFFNDNLRSQARFMMYLNESLYHYVSAYISGSDDEKLEHLTVALKAAYNVRESIRESAHGSFTSWYSSESVFNLSDYIQRISETWRQAGGETGEQCFFFEPEDYADQSLFDPFYVAEDPNACNSKYIDCDFSGNMDAPSEDGRVTYEFVVDEMAAFYVWIKVIAASVTDDSFWIIMDGVPYKFNLIELSSAWIWDMVPGSFDLQAGKHILEIVRRESNTRLDKVLITSDPNYKPQGCDVCSAGPSGSGGEITNPDRHLNIYPNPASDRLFINPPEGITGHVLIYDFMGRRVKSISMDHENTIALNDLSDGMYVFDIQISSLSLRKKVLISQQ